jgi:hypothetical protein
VLYRSVVTREYLSSARARSDRADDVKLWPSGAPSASIPIARESSTLGRRGFGLLLVRPEPSTSSAGQRRRALRATRVAEEAARHGWRVRIEYGLQSSGAKLLRHGARAADRSSLRRCAPEHARFCARSQCRSGACCSRSRAAHERARHGRACGASEDATSRVFVHRAEQTGKRTTEVSCAMWNAPTISSA